MAESIGKMIIKDQVEIKDKLATPKIEGVVPRKTRILIKNANTGEVLRDVENKCVITGGIMNAAYAYDIKPPIVIPSYNDEMQLDNTHASREEPYNHPKICLFAVGDSGCGPTPKDVYVAQYVDRIKPAPARVNVVEDFDNQMIFPFRWVNIDEDLNSDLRQFYYGRKTYDTLGKIGYYFKAFDTEPQMHLRYADGTQITEDIYINPTDQMAECYVETRLRITKLDFRDYFNDVLGWDNARISTISMLYGWYDDTIDQYRWYQDVYPYTKLNFAYIWLVDSNYALDVIYQIYY